MSILLDIVMDTMKKEFSKEEPLWRMSSSLDDAMPDTVHFLRNECNKESEFDPLSIRKKMIDGMDRGELKITIARCMYGQVMVVYDKKTTERDIPWGLWGRILRMYSEKGMTFKIFVLANSKKREFPVSEKKVIRAENINGGYTYHCNPETVMIYRIEDATRVLLHELMHSCCLDNMENGVDRVEAETEAWAELMYIGCLSEGKEDIFYELLERQSCWMIEQNEKVRRYMKDPSSKEFPWRYTIGKEEIWEKWGILIKKKGCKVGKSLRLTYPPSNDIKRHFRISDESTAL
jgi:hypothetical protein